MSLEELPSDLPVPVDDGGADHLLGARLPELQLHSCEGQLVALGSLPGICVIYVYPMTGRPDTALPPGWEAIPGARGCTPQSCAFRDHYTELQALHAQVYGLSVQSPDYQREAQQRLQLPFALLSDAGLSMRGAMGLPTFEAQGQTLYKRLTLIAIDGVVEKVFYPVFPPGDNAAAVLAWLQQQGAR